MEGSNNTTQESREPFVVRCEPMITNLLGKKIFFCQFYSISNYQCLNAPRSYILNAVVCVV